MSPDQRLPVTVIARECDLRLPIRQAADDLEAQSAGAGLIVTDIFEVDDLTYSDPVRSSMAGTARLDEARLRTERHMAVSYFWNAEQLALIQPRGALVNPGRAPLTADQIQTVQRQLARHPEYRGQTMMMRASDDSIVTWRDGAAAITPPPEGVAIKNSDVSDQGHPLPEDD